jgi:glycerol-3-phosphate dehydrogenase
MIRPDIGSVFLTTVGNVKGRCDAIGMTLRGANIDRLRDGLFDVLVIGAGINGAVSAAALAGRGASVAMIDRGDFGSFTSQESSNLVWGGFKYLEHY